MAADDEWRDPPEPELALEPRIPEAPDVEEAKDPSTPKEKSVGGFSFYLSLFALLPTGILTLLLALATWQLSFMESTCTFIAGVVGGSVLAKIFIKGHISVLIHEFKHQIISNLVGNKSRGMKIGENSGHFEYAYSKKTTHYHAFISLAPYILPLFTFILSLIAFAVCREDHKLAALVVGIGYGADLLLNMRDISPIQTDINQIRGGYTIGLIYIAAWNFFILGVLLTWAFQGMTGFAMLLEEFSALFVMVHQYLRAPAPGPEL
jgi:hypothetical protein